MINKVNELVLLLENIRFLAYLRARIRWKAGQYTLESRVFPRVLEILTKEVLRCLQRGKLKPGVRV
jgi:hypothetical protein